MDPNIQKKLCDYLFQKQKTQITKQIPLYKPEHPITVKLELDLFDISNYDQFLGNFIIKNFPIFLKKLPDLLLYLINKEQEKSRRQNNFKLEKIYCIPNLINFPINENPILDIFEQKEIIDKNIGILLNLKKILIIHVFEPEYYLWNQTFNPTCWCQGE